MAGKMTLKAARVNKDLTQEQAASLLGVTKDVVSNWERRITFPDVIMLGRIEEVYGVSYNDLIFLPEENA
ncbi:MAG: helix-turn-helix transcriptional regulator [Parasporobacterium sp.]|nr:helix-turn-helix transcriptional regulator [Parasporobacterium sp.]